MAKIQDPQTQGIFTSYDHLLHTNFHSSDLKDFQELLKQVMDGAADPDSDDLTADCLDHAYFLEEIRQLLRM